MAYYPLGNIVDVGIVDDDRYVSALGQILDGLSHLHAKGVAHRDLKPENFLIEMDPLFKIVIADFGLAKIASDNALLKTYCGSLKYAAPEVFPGLSSGHGPPVDVWSLGIIVFKWIYGIPNPPDVPKPKKKNEEVSAQKLYDWIDAWAERLLNKLEDQENDQVIQILVRMIQVKVRSRSGKDGLRVGACCRVSRVACSKGGWLMVSSCAQATWTTSTCPWRKETMGLRRHLRRQRLAQNHHGLRASMSSAKWPS